MPRVYLTVYKPHMNTDKPYLYVGSTSRGEDSCYLGSVRSKEWKQWWDDETKNNPDDFDHFTLSWHSTRAESIAEELSVQRSMNVVKDKRFFNKSYAKKNGFFGMDVSGLNNPMAGTSRKGHKVGGAVSPMYGKENPCWGKNPMANKTADEVKAWKEKVARPGKLNGCYGSTFIWINKNGEHKRHNKAMPIPLGWSIGFTKVAAMQESRKRKVRCIDTGIVYSSQTEAAIATGSEGSKICLCCSGKRKRTNNLQWEYV